MVFPFDYCRFWHFSKPSSFIITISFIDVHVFLFHQLLCISLWNFYNYERLTFAFCIRCLQKTAIALCFCTLSRLRFLSNKFTHFVMIPWNTWLSILPLAVWSPLFANQIRWLWKFTFCSQNKINRYMNPVMTAYKCPKIDKSLHWS